MSRNRRSRKTRKKKHIHPLSSARTAVNERGRRPSWRAGPPRNLKISIDEPVVPGLFLVPESIPATWLKFFIGLLLFPLCWITSEAFFISFQKAALNGVFWRTTEFWWFALGCLAGLLIFFFARGKILLVLYVFGHELTHAIFAVLCFGRVEGFKANAQGGHILTNRNNFLVSLSPYFVPFYTVFVLGIYALAGLFLDYERLHPHWWFSLIVFGLIGLTWTLHLSFTVWMILKNQPDLTHNGTFFSLTLIYLVNLVIITGMFIVASPFISARAFSTTWLTQAYTLPERVAATFQGLIEYW